MIRSLEGLRGIAALIVALYHLGIGAQQFSVIRNGYLFVDLFFVLSGFIMCAAYGRRLAGAEDLRMFLMRRIGRLFPLLVFSTLVFVLGWNMIVLAKRISLEHGYGAWLNNPGALEWLVPSTTEVLSTLTLTHGLGVFDHLILNTPSWSISVEFYAYILFAALCLGLAGRARLTAFALASLLGFVLSLWASTTVHDCLNRGGCLSLTYDFGFPRAVFSFFLGALAFHAGRHIRSGHAFLQVLALGLLAASLALVDAHRGLAFCLPFVYALLILSVGADTGPLAHVLKASGLQRLGLWSYSIYLMHMPLLLFFGNFASRAQGALQSSLVLLAFVAVLLAVSAFTYRYVEDPMRAWFNRLAASRTTAVRRTSA